MALYYRLHIVIWNKMAVKLDFLSCRGQMLSLFRAKGQELIQEELFNSYSRFFIE